MKEKGHHVNITLQSIIDDSGEREVNTFQQLGKIFKRDHFEVLLYEEVDEDGDKIRNLITIQPDRVSIKRSGLISMNQQFEINRKTETYYNHPHGSLHMEIYTKSIDYHPLKENGQGRLNINYTVKLNGILERKHLLELTYHEEDYQ